jgi:hypothetical protein
MSYFILSNGTARFFKLSMNIGGTTEKALQIITAKVTLHQNICLNKQKCTIEEFRKVKTIK